MEDRNERARARIRLISRVQKDRTIGHGIRAVIRCIVMDLTCIRTLRARATYGCIADMAGVDRATVARAIPHLARYGISVHRTTRVIQARNGAGWVRARDTNLYLVDLPKSQDATEFHPLSFLDALNPESRAVDSVKAGENVRISVVNQCRTGRGGAAKGAWRGSVGRGGPATSALAG